MPDDLQVFISYKKHGGQTPDYAKNIAGTLREQYGFEVFIDIERIDTADHWEQKIYDEIHRADVLILLLEPETAKSDWVQREVDFARGSGVEVLPLLMVDRRQVDITEAMQKLALSSVQHSDHFQQTEADYTKLAANIRRLALSTRAAQREQYHRRESHWFRLPTDLQLKQYSYQMKDDQLPGVCVHLTTGDILDMPPGTLDVMVNSENDYLEMARLFEVNGLSARLRKAGAYFRNGRLIEDTVQKDLLAAYPDPLPVPLQQVIVTKAGHEHGELRSKKRVKFIFHAITVRFDVGSMHEPIHALTNDVAIQETIWACFEKVAEVNQDAELRESVDLHFSEITSIAFPMFGTGMAGRPINQVAPAMVEGLYKALNAAAVHGAFTPFTLHDIHLLVYSPHEVTPLKAALDKRFAAVNN